MNKTLISIGDIFIRVLFWYLRKICKQKGGCTVKLVGKDKYYPRYILYTEDPAMRVKMDKFWYSL